MNDFSGMSRRGFMVATAATAAAAALASCGQSGGGSPSGKKSLRIAMYGDAGQEAFMETVAKPFGAKYGVAISQASYGDQNEMLANVNANPGVYDLVRCSDFAIHDGIIT